MYRDYRDRVAPALTAGACYLGAEQELVAKIAAYATGQANRLMQP
ncbi:hypothetical protein Hsc_0816 [Herbaspirillum seropedicae]|nr:hypothetical protein Hsc_0816 [Herbaspirillum seropedicae]